MKRTADQLERQARKQLAEEALVRAAMAQAKALNDAIDALFANV